MSDDSDDDDDTKIKTVTPQEGNIIRAITALNGWMDICGLGREAIGRELTKYEATESGRRAALLWRKLTGLKRPSYAHMPKRSTGKNYAAHLKSVYPPSWADRVQNVIREVVEANAVANGFTAYERAPSEHPLEGTVLYEMFCDEDENEG